MDTLGQRTGGRAESCLWAAEPKTRFCSSSPARVRGAPNEKDFSRPFFALAEAVILQQSTNFIHYTHKDDRHGLISSSHSSATPGDSRRDGLQCDSAGTRA